MTVVDSLDFDAGTEGAAVSVSGSWSKIGSSSTTYAAAAAAHGAMGCRFSNTGTSGRFQYDYGSPQTGVLVLSLYVTPRTNASAHQYVALAISAPSGGSNRGDVRINNTSRTVSIRNVSSAVATSSTALAVGTTYRLEWHLDHGASTQTLRIYVGDATTATEEISGAYSAADTRVLAFGPYAAASGGATDYDSVQVADDWTGPYDAGTPYPDPDPGFAFLVGDSLTAQSPGPGTADMESRLLAAGFTSARVDGTSGQFVYNLGDSDSTSADIDEVVALGTNPGVVIAALGTNDTLSSLSSNWATGLSNFRAKLAASLPGTHEVYFVNVVAAPDNPGGMDGEIGTKSNTVADWNAWIASQVDGVHEHVLDWNAYAQANLTDLAYWNTSDGIHVHMTSSGYTERNAWIAAQFDTGTKSGSATGALSWAGTAVGSRVSAGVAAGVLAFTGTAVGHAEHHGQASGAIVWAGTSAGSTGHAGTATGTLAWTGQRPGAPNTTAPPRAPCHGRARPAGTRPTTAMPRARSTGPAPPPDMHPPSGSPTAPLSGRWHGSASRAARGRRPGPRPGSSHGLGTAAGHAPTVDTAHGSAAGTLTWAGTAAGSTSHHGTATGPSPGRVSPSPRTTTPATSPSCPSSSPSALSGSSMPAAPSVSSKPPAPSPSRSRREAAPARP